MLFVATRKFFADVAVGKVRQTSVDFLSFLDGTYADTLAEIKKSGKLEDDTKAALSKACDEFRLAHPELFA